ncbi:MAG TPA: FAD:protein FMN transferase [Candidatus Saccharimonadia bacterium]|nr:FAD:protein FMN transferase [Candidatus Saccharimonadia bacterium]
MPRFRFEFAQMGCPCELVLDADSEACAQRAARAAVAEVARLDHKYSHYRDDSYLAELDAAAGRGAVEVDAETAALLDFADALHRESGGRFDITAGALVRLWDPRTGRLPDRGEVERARATVGWSRAGWRERVLELPAGMRLDLGGIVKEYAADRAADACREHGVERGLVVLGGDIAVIGPRADGSGWRVGISEPSSPSRARRTVPVRHGGFATSGDYERCMVVDGRRYSHLLDVALGEPVLGYASVSVAAPSCLVAGALATLAMLAGIEDGAALLARSGMDWLALAGDGSETGPLARA